ncbi:MAG: FkbM family methyltransferase [Alphaproteobacteria bacterium]|nr:FkbM family methyltransferase [Alphaproteobacteria bacterium]
MSRTLASIVNMFCNVITCTQNVRRKAYTKARVVELFTDKTYSAKIKGNGIHFCGLSVRALHDPVNILNDEPETIKWLDDMPKDAVLWDIGANVGTYSIYAAAVNGTVVKAFEPSATSYAAMVRNIEKNNLSDLIDSFCIAFDNASKLGYLNMANTDAGHSMHAFDRDETVKGELKTVFKQSVLGFSVDDFVKCFDISKPTHVKIDVDSIEFEILQGAKKTLTSPGVKSVLVEIDGKTRDEGGANIRQLLSDIGFREEENYVEKARRNVVFVK